MQYKHNFKIFMCVKNLNKGIPREYIINKEKKNKCKTIRRKCKKKLDYVYLYIAFTIHINVFMQCTSILTYLHTYLHT